MFISFKKDKKDKRIKELESEIQRLKGLIFLKDLSLAQSNFKLEEEIKINVELSHFRIKILDALGLIGVHKNDEIAIKEVKRLKLLYLY